MKTLIIDNNRDPDYWGANDLVHLTHQVVPGATVFVRRAPNRDLPSEVHRFDRILISGSLTSALDTSPWTQELDQWIRTSLEHKVPILGICYGHQALARAIGGQNVLRKSPTPELGWTHVQKETSSRLTDSLPSSFDVFSNHHDDVTQLPSEAETILSSKDCAIQGFQVKNSPAYGLQFHPEKTAQEASNLLKKWKKQDDTDRCFDAKVGSTLFKNFFVGLD